jgi:hypothetical protein
MNRKLPIQANLQVFSKSSRIETSYQTLSGPNVVSPKIQKSAIESPSWTLFTPVGFWILAQWLVSWELYKYTSTSNGSFLLATALSYWTSSFPSFKEAKLTLP